MKLTIPQRPKRDAAVTLRLTEKAKTDLVALTTKNKCSQSSLVIALLAQAVAK